VSRSSSQSSSVMIRASIDSESLEKIHTFSLKRNNDNCTVNDNHSSNNDNTPSKAFYVEEKIKVMDSHIILSDSILKELV
jgi:hypothetical protein